jgi:hypothetical protein
MRWSLRRPTTSPRLGAGANHRKIGRSPSSTPDAQGSPNYLRSAAVSWRKVQQSFAYAMSSSVDCQTRHTLTSVSRPTMARCWPSGDHQAVHLTRPDGFESVKA